MTLVVALLLPVLVASLAGGTAVGALRATAERVRAAADLAVVVAANDQDDAELALSGRLALASDAPDVARAAFAANLEGVAPFLAASPAAIAAAAEVEASSTRIALRARVPLRTLALAVLAIAPVVTVDVRSAAAPR